jgi:hypothetical protein
MIRKVLAPVLLLGLGACAANPQGAERSYHSPELEAGTAYRVEVENESACPATVRLGSGFPARAKWIGTVPPHAKDSFLVTPERKGQIQAVALEEDGRMCDNRLVNPVRLRVARAE